MFPLKDTNPSNTTPYVNYFIILANIIVFFYENSVNVDIDNFVLNYGFIPSRFFTCADCIDMTQRIVPLFSSMFLHGGFMHLLGNVYFLYIFGDNIEDKLGHFKYLLTYLSFGAFAALTQGVVNVDSVIPMIGASGAIAGVMGTYMIFFPKAKIKTLIFIFIAEIPAFIFLLIWFLFQLNKGVNISDGGVAWWAHIGGFAVGLIFALIIKNKSVPEKGDVFDKYY